MDHDPVSLGAAKALTGHRFGMPISLYTAGRICGVLVRPACLFAANNYFPADAARALAAAFLASSLAMVATAADPHRRYYTLHFGRNPQATGLAFYVYVSGLCWMTLLGVILTVVVAFRFTGSVAAAAVAAGFFVSERLADEFLRLRFFERDFAGWGRITVLRSTLQAAGLLILALAWDFTTGWAAVLVLALVNVAVFAPRVPSGVVHLPRHRRLSLWLARRGAAALLQHWRVWAIAALGASVGYLDRLAALLVEPSLLPLFLLDVMTFSIVPIAVDFYYVSKHRRDFLQQQLTLETALANREFAASFLISLVVAGIACVVVLFLSRNGSEFPLMYVLVVAIVQGAAALTVVPQQLLYWNREFDRILRADVAFWLLFGAAALVAVALGATPGVTMTAAAACAVGRCILYAAWAAKVPASVQSPPLIVLHEAV